MTVLLIPLTKLIAIILMTDFIVFFINHLSTSLSLPKLRLIYDNFEKIAFPASNLLLKTIGNIKRRAWAF